MSLNKFGVGLLVCILCFDCSIGTGWAQTKTKSAAKKKRPNILFIAVDDLRPELGCYGVKEIKTPNLDRLADRGVLFNRAYCQQAVCNPSRASLMSGLRPDSTKVWDLVTPLRSTLPDVVTLPQYFKQNGYYTVGMGKIFHNTFPDATSWTDGKQQKPKGPIRMWSKEVLKARKQWQDEAIETGMPERLAKHMRATATDCEDVADNVRIDGALGDLALEQLKKASEQPLPFFLAVGFIQPHLPFTPPKKYWDLYDPEKIPPATNDFLPRGMPPLAFGDRSHGGMYELMYHLDFKDAPGPFEGSLTEAQCRRLKHGYYAAVSFIDAQVGRIIDELDRLGLADDTIIVLWGDHGWKLGEHHSWCKQTNFEIDTRVPLMIVRPGAEGNGKTTDALAEFVDIYPTLCELAGLPVPKNLEGDSLAPLLEKPESSVKPMAISQFRRRYRNEDYMGYAMRTDRYRYVEWILRRTGKTFCIEIYDHQNDPEENENIAAKPGHEALAKELSDMLWKKIPRPKPVRMVNKKKPNVLFIAVDDLRPELGCYGNRAIKSPNIDRLAASGVTFTRAYCQSAACNQSRASLMTGLRPDSIRVWDLFTDFRSNRPDVVALPQAFKQHGYHTAAIGKIYHNNIPDDASWSEPKLYVPGYPFDPDAVYRKQENIDRLAERRKEIMAAGTQDKYLDRFGEWYLKTASTECIDVPDDAYYDGAQTTMALEKLAELKRRGGPFFLGVGYYRPHLPFNAPKKYWDMYDRDKIPLAENDFLPKDAPPMAINNMAELRRSYEDFHGTPRPEEGPLTESQMRLLRHGYYASVSYTDAQIGRLLDGLEKLGLADNTIVVLWGDHGWKLGEHRSWCKMTNYEIDTHVPLIVRMPGAKENGKPCNALVEYVDIYPTLCDLAGIAAPDGLEGSSMASFLKDAKGPSKKAVFSQFLRSGKWSAPDGVPYMGYAIRTPQWRLVEWYQWDEAKQARGQLVARELYDQQADPQENVNLAESAEHADIVARLARQLQAGWQAAKARQ